MDIPISVSLDGQEVASGTLSVDTSTTPQTGTFTPDNGTGAVTCNSVSWSSAPGGATNFSFRLTASNGQFPVPPNTPSYTYSFTGNENANATQANGNVNWPQNDPSIKGDETATWQGEATEGEPYAQRQSAS